jgi:hypothetical protein
VKAVVSKQASEAMSELSDSDLATLENLNKNVAASSTLNDVIKRAGLSRILKRTPEGRQIYLSRQGGLNLLYSITEDEQRMKLARLRGYFPLGGERSTHGTQTAHPSVPT